MFGGHRGSVRGGREDRTPPSPESLHLPEEVPREVHLAGEDLLKRLYEIGQDEQEIRPSELFHNRNESYALPGKVWNGIGVGPKDVRNSKIKVLLKNRLFVGVGCKLYDGLFTDKFLCKSSFGKNKISCI